MKLKSRIIVNNYAKITDEDAVMRVFSVISKGKISEANNKKHYCWVCSWKDGISVGVTPKYKTDSEIFSIWDRNDLR